MEFNRKDGMIYLGDESRPDAYVTWKLHDDVMHVDHTVVKPSLRSRYCWSINGKTNSFC